VGPHLIYSEDIPPDQFLDVLPNGQRAQYLVRAMLNDFAVSGGGKTVDVATVVVSRIAEQAADARFNGEFPDLLASLAKRAQNAGYGPQETAAIVKVLRSSPPAWRKSSFLAAGCADPVQIADADHA